MIDDNGDLRIRVTIIGFEMGEDAHGYPAERHKETLLEVCGYPNKSTIDMMRKQVKALLDVLEKAKI